MTGSPPKFISQLLIDGHSFTIIAYYIFVFFLCAKYNANVGEHHRNFAFITYFFINLARIEVTSAEADDVLRKLTGIFTLIEEMRRVDTTGIAPMSHAQDVHLALREDAVTQGDRRELFQSSAPATADGLYLVPKVIE